MTRVSREQLDENLQQKMKQIRLERYACQSVARLALSGERVCNCLRMTIPNKLVDVYRHRKTSKAFYGGLAICGSVWHCPVCAAKVSERRKVELEQAFSAHKLTGGRIYLLTLTFSHKKTDDLKVILELFGKATTRLFGGKAFNRLRETMGLIGRVRSYECTYGKNGFHPHVHIALFTTRDFDLNAMRTAIYKQWHTACVANGLSASAKHGVDLQTGDDAQAYLSKNGTWSMEQEMSKSHVKKAKDENMTPFDFLRHYLVSSDEKLLKLFKVYAKAFKGKRQLQWSPGLKAMYAVEEKTDAELANEKIEEADLLGTLDFWEWRTILDNEQRAQLLSNIENYGFEDGLGLTLVHCKIKKESSLHEDSQIKEI